MADPTDIRDDGWVSIPADLARARYGRRPQHPRRRMLIVGTIIAVLVLVWFVSVSRRVGNPAVTWQDIGYRVVSDGNAEITFDLTFAGRVDGDGQAVCTLNAQNELHTDVGLRDITVGPASRRRLTVTATLPTSERANTVLVKECVLR